MRRQTEVKRTRNPRSESDEQSFVFRRSRTITGSTTDTVRSSAEHRGQLRSPRLHEHSLRQHRRRLTGLLIVCFVLIGGLTYVVNAYIPRPTSVRLAVSQPISTKLDQDRYIASVDTYLANHPMERFDFTINQDNFSQYMSQVAPELRSSQLLSGKLFSGSDVTVELREPIVSWKINDKTYYVDSDGFAFERNAFRVPALIVSDKSGIPSDVGVIASDKLLRFIARVVTLVNANQAVQIDSITLPANSTRQVDVKLKGRQYVVRTNLDRDPAGQAMDIVNAVTYFDAKQINPSYVDVRVSSKAFYR